MHRGKGGGLRKIEMICKGDLGNSHGNRETRYKYEAEVKGQLYHVRLITGIGSFLGKQALFLSCNDI